jgi:hypothetical protein
VQAHEFLNQAWNKPPMKTICANLLSSIDHFNEVSQWVRAPESSSTTTTSPRFAPF